MVELFFQSTAYNYVKVSCKQTSKLLYDKQSHILHNNFALRASCIVHTTTEKILVTFFFVPFPGTEILWAPSRLH